MNFSAQLDSLGDEEGGVHGKKQQKKRRPSDGVDDLQMLEDLEATATGLLAHQSSLRQLSAEHLAKGSSCYAGSKN